VFDRISFPRRSVFYRLSRSNDSNRDGCSHGVISDQGVVHQMQNTASHRGLTNQSSVRQIEKTAVPQVFQPVEDLSLNLNLSLGQQDFEP
jgi:hypothetical protein